MGSMRFYEEVSIPEADIKHWSPILSQGLVDYKEHNLSEFSSVYVVSAVFGDGAKADIYIKTGSAEDGNILGEMVVHDKHGREVACSTDTCRELTGEWLARSGDSEGRSVKYIVDISQAVDVRPVFERLGIEKEDFSTVVCQSLENGISSEYSAILAERICIDVAWDVYEAADPSEWNDSDVRLGIGRAILKGLGVDV